MPLFGKRKGDMTPEEQAAARQRRRELLETIGATMSDVGLGLQGGQGGQMAALRKRREDAADEAQRIAAFGDLVGRIQPPDTYTPQVNQLIGAANETGARFGMAPMQRETPRQAGLDLQDPATRQALMSFVGAGGNIDTPFALADRIAPKAVAPKVFNVGDGTIVAVDEQGVAEPVYTSPLLQDFQRARIGATNAQAGQRTAQGNAALIRANRPPARGGGGGGGAMTPRPTGKVY